MFQSPDGDFVYSDLVVGYLKSFTSPSFNPLTGISSILTGDFTISLDGSGTSFNPLTGISSILTRGQAYPVLLPDKFQSPDGDFVYSDNEVCWPDNDLADGVSIP